jgi:hypothetical protein
VTLILVLVLVLALGGLIMALPRIAASESVRGKLQAAAREATGQEVRWEKVAFGLVPPRLVVVRPRIGSGEPSEPPRLEAENVDLRVAFLPLLARAVVIDSLVIEGVTLRLVRTPKGVELPVGKLGSASAEPKRGEAEREGTQLSLAVRDLRLVSSRFLLEDQTVTPSHTWDLTNLDLRARGESLDSAIGLEASAALASGGSLFVEGSAWLDGRIDLEAKLDRVVLGPAQAYLERGQQLEGALSGTVKVKGPAASPEAITADLSLVDGLVDIAGVLLRGRLTVQAHSEGELGKGSGRFEIDASDADLAYGEAFQKPRGKPAKLSGRLIPSEGEGLALDEVRIRLRNLDASGRIRTAPRLGVELEAPPFELEGWGESLPALASLEPKGRAAFQKLQIANEPLDVRGTVVFDGLRLRPPEREPIVLRGQLQGVGNAVRSQDMTATVADQTVMLDVELGDLATRPGYRVRARTDQADINALLAALAGLPGTLEGPLTSNAELSGPAGGERPPLEALGGTARLEIGKGKLHGVSLLRGSFERLGAFGEAALLVGALRGGKTLQRFYGDEFESITGTFTVANGKAKTNDLKMIYQNYTVELRGSMGLLDETLEMSGTLTIDEAVDGAIASAQEGAGPTAPTGRRKVIPLARVGGTLRAPRVDLSPDAVASLATSYAVGRRRESVERKIDEKLGEGAGREVLDTLDGLLRGGARSRTSE